MNLLYFLYENWFALVALICLLVYAIVRISSEAKSLRIWLKYAVSLAEKELGSGTGALKLRQVYNEALKLFPWAANFVSFDKFSDWVDEALVWMRGQLENNPNFLNYIVPSKQQKTVGKID